MSRIAGCFESLRGTGRTALVPYVTAGDPNPDATVPLMHAMVGAGADVIELGVPFSDPMADGPVIQAACERALKHHVSLTHVLTLVTRFRQRDTQTPVVLMGYLNPVEVMGYERFATAAADAGVDGVLVVDLPPEECHDLSAALATAGVDTILLVAPTSDERRIERITRVASGFVYYVSLKGVTGASNLDTAAVKEKVDQIRRHTRLPIGVGFGIKDAVSAARVAAFADAVVVGSALVRHLADNPDDMDSAAQKISAVLGSMRRALDEGAAA